MADRASVSHITDDAITAGADAIADLLSLLGVDPDEAIEGGDAPPVGRQLAELVLQAGVAVGCTAATAGAPVSPVQTTDHADSRVSPVADDMVRRGAAALTESSGEVYEVRVTEPMVARRIAEQVLSAALAGRMAEPDEGERQTLMHILDEHLDAPDMADWERRDRARRARLYADRVLSAGYRSVVPATGSQVGGQHGDA